MTESLVLYTVGHGSRGGDELIELLRAAAVATLVDIRAQPQSRRHPQYNMAMLREAAGRAGLAYHWAGRQLGGMRAPRADSRHWALRDDGLRGFADYIDDAGFQRGLAQLLKLAAAGPTAMLCAEREPLNCHRSVIADYLVLQGARVLHLMSPGELREHQLRPEARRESAALIYDRQATAALDL